MFRKIRKTVSIVILAAFITTSVKSPAYGSTPLTTGAQSAQQGIMPRLPAPGVMVHLSPEFTPAHLQGITIHPDNALQFDFLIHKSDQELDGDQKKEEYKKLVKYFLASLTIPDEDQWVNLSPYEKDRIIKDDFGKTEMGRDLLAEDYLLKQITSSLIYPEDGLGKKFWDKIYERAWNEYHTTNIPVNTFNKVWIVPDQAYVYESGNTAYILQSHLKVMLEEDYLSLQKHRGVIASEAKQSFSTVIPSPSTVIPAKAGIQTNTIGSQVIREIILPELEKEVNEGKNFANLRQMYSGMILATWYKKALKESLLGKIYADKAKVKGVDQDPKANEAIYQRYLKAFKKGVFNYIKEDVDKYTDEAIPRKYFSGGWKGFNAALIVTRNTPKEYFRRTGILLIADPATISLIPNIDRASIASNDSLDRATVAVNPEEEMPEEGGLGFYESYNTPGIPGAINPAEERRIRENPSGGVAEVMPEEWTVVIAEDEVWILMDLEDFFREKDFNVLTATNPEDLRRIMATRVGKKTLLVTDTTGWVETVKKIFDNDKENIRIIATSGADSENAWKIKGELIVPSNVFRFLPKLHSPKQLKATVDGILSKKNPAMTAKKQPAKTQSSTDAAMKSRIDPLAWELDTEVAILEHGGRFSITQLNHAGGYLALMGLIMDPKKFKPMLKMNDKISKLGEELNTKRKDIWFMLKGSITEDLFVGRGLNYADVIEWLKRDQYIEKDKAGHWRATKKIDEDGGKLASKFPNEQVRLVKILQDSYAAQRGIFDQNKLIKYQEEYREFLEKILSEIEKIKGWFNKNKKWFGREPKGLPLIDPANEGRFIEYSRIVSNAVDDLKISLEGITAMMEENSDPTSLQPHDLRLALGSDPKSAPFIFKEVTPPKDPEGKITFKWRNYQVMVHNYREPLESRFDTKVLFLAIERFFENAQKVVNERRWYEQKNPLAPKMRKSIKVYFNQNSTKEGLFNTITAVNSGSFPRNLLEEVTLVYPDGRTEKVQRIFLLETDRPSMDEGGVGLSFLYHAVKKYGGTVTVKNRRIMNNGRSFPYAHIEISFPDASHAMIAMGTKKGHGATAPASFDTAMSGFININKENAAEFTAWISAVEYRQSAWADRKSAWAVRNRVEAARRTTIEGRLKSIIADVLRVSSGKVLPRDSLFDLGANRWKRLEIFQRLQDEFNIKINYRKNRRDYTIGQLSRDIQNFTDAARERKIGVDRAQIAPKGGIDFNAANLNLQIKRDGNGAPLPWPRQDMAQLSRIQGFEPEIIEIKPAVNVPILSELQQKLQHSSI